MDPKRLKEAEAEDAIRRWAQECADDTRRPQRARITIINLGTDEELLSADELSKIEEVN